MTVRSDNIHVQCNEWANAPVASGVAVWILPFQEAYAVRFLHYLQRRP